MGFIFLLFPYVMNEATRYREVKPPAPRPSVSKSNSKHLNPESLLLTCSFGGLFCSSVRTDILFNPPTQTHTAALMQCNKPCLHGFPHDGQHLSNPNKSFLPFIASFGIYTATREAMNTDSKKPFKDIFVFYFYNKMFHASNTLKLITNLHIGETYI